MAPTGKPLSVNGVVMPDDFPVDALEAIHSRFVSKVRAQGEIYGEYAGALNAVSYRFLAATEYSDDFTASITQFRGAPSPPERHRQERALSAFLRAAYQQSNLAFMLFSQSQRF
jgi:hypothetical protein